MLFLVLLGLNSRARFSNSNVYQGICEFPANPLKPSQEGTPKCAWASVVLVNSATILWGRKI